MIVNKVDSVYGVVKQADPKYYYTGINTDTTSITIDNKDKFIKVDVNTENLLGEDHTKAYPGDKGSRNRRDIDALSSELYSEIERSKDLDKSLDEYVTLVQNDLSNKLSAAITSVSIDLQNETSRATNSENNLKQQIKILSDNVDLKFIETVATIQALETHVTEQESKFDQSLETLSDNIVSTENRLNDQLNTISNHIAVEDKKIMSDTLALAKDLEKSFNDKIIETNATIQQLALQAGKQAEEFEKALSDSTLVTNTKFLKVETAQADLESEIDQLSDEQEQTRLKLEKVEADTDDAIQKVLTYIEELHPVEFISVPRISGNSLEQAGRDTTSRKVVWELNRKADTFDINGAKINLDPVSNTGSSYHYEYTWNDITQSNNMLSIKAIKGTHETTVNTVTLTYTYYVYWGSAKKFASDASGIDKKLSTTKSIGSITVNVKDDEYFYFACPSAYKTPTFSVNGFIGGVFKTDESFTQEYVNEAIVYDVYRSNQSSLGQTTFNVV